MNGSQLWLSDDSRRMFDGYRGAVLNNFCLPKERFDSLTGLRGLFIFVIAAYHAGASIGHAFLPVMRPIYTWGGYFGNYFFFLLSGFLTCHTQRERIGQDSIGIFRYSWRRIRKIYALYLGTNILMLAYSLIQNGFNADVKLDKLASVLFMVTTGWIDDIYPYNIPTWFLSTLLLCHIIYYCIALLYKNRKDFYYVLLLVLMIWGAILERKN